VRIATWRVTRHLNRFEKLINSERRSRASNRSKTIYELLMVLHKRSNTQRRVYFLRQDSVSRRLQNLVSSASTMYLYYSSSEAVTYTRVCFWHRYSISFRLLDLNVLIQAPEFFRLVSLKRNPPSCDRLESIGVEGGHRNFENNSDKDRLERKREGMQKKRKYECLRESSRHQCL